jgi:DNA-binding LacI/PurR family transcriptional regulator
VVSMGSREVGDADAAREAAPSTIRKVNRSSVTIIDIAQETGVSKTTVADALSGSGRVSQQTRARVLDAASRLGYTSNRAARSLRSGRNGALGVYVPPAVRELSFYMQFVFGAADRAGRDGDDLTLLAAPDDGRRSSSLQIDGVIIVDPVPGDPVCEELLASNLPVVSVGAPVDAVYEGLAVTRIPYEDAIPSFLDQWRRGGEDPIAFIRPDDTFSTPWRRDIQNAIDAWAVDRAVEVHGFELPVVPTDEELREVLSQVGAASVSYIRYLFAAEMVAGRAAGIIGSRDGVQIATLSGDPGTELTNPRIAAMDLGARRFGAHAVEFLQDIVKGVVAPGGERLFDLPRYLHV